MSLVTYPNISRTTLYSKTWKDELYNQMYKSLYDKGILKKLSDIGESQDEDGSNSDCTYLQLFYLEQYINYLILLKDEATKTTLTQDQLVNLRDNIYKLPIIRANFLCRFGNSNNIDIIKAIVNLGNIAGINNLTQDGLDYMIFDPNSPLLGNELIINSSFNNPSLGWIDVLNNILITGLSGSLNLKNYTTSGVTQQLSLIVGHTYKFQLTVISAINPNAIAVFNSSVDFGINNLILQINTPVVNNTVYEITFVATQVTLLLTIITNTDFILTNVSLREIIAIGNNNNNNDFIIQ
jgi:hypothetical protein